MPRQNSQRVGSFVAINADPEYRLVKLQICRSTGCRKLWIVQRRYPVYTYAAPHCSGYRNSCRDTFVKEVAEPAVYHAVEIALPRGVPWNRLDLRMLPKPPIRVLPSDRCWTVPALSNGVLYVRDLEQMRAIELVTQ